MVSMPLGIKTILQLWKFFWKEEWYLLNSIIDQIDKNDFLNKRGWGFSQGNGLFINEGHEQRADRIQLSDTET